MSKRTCDLPAAADSRAAQGRIGWRLAGVSTAGMRSSSLQGRIHGVPRQTPPDPDPLWNFSYSRPRHHPPSAGLAQQIDAVRLEEVGAAGRQVGLEGRADAGLPLRVQVQLGVGDLEEAVGEDLPGGVGAGHLKEDLRLQGEETALDRLDQGLKGRLAHLALIVDQAEDGVEIAPVDRFAEVGQAAGDQDAVDLAQGRGHEVPGHMVQGLEHEDGVEAGVRGGDGLGPPVAELDARDRRLGQVLFELDAVDLGGQDPRRPEALRQQPGHPAGAAAQLQQLPPFQAHQGGDQLDLAGLAIGLRGVETHRAGVLHDHYGSSSGREWAPRSA